MLANTPKESWDLPKEALEKCEERNTEAIALLEVH